MIRIIRLLGAAIGRAGRHRLATATGAVPRNRHVGALILAGWIVAWLVVGFAMLPYLTVVPATLADRRRVQELSTAEFVTAVGRPADRPRDGPPAGAPALQLARPARPLAAARGVDRPRSRDGRPDRCEAQRPDRGGRGDRYRPAPGGRGLVARKGEPYVVVDTSAIIDGRIADIVESGFLYGTLVVPRFVLDELQRSPTTRTRCGATADGAGLEILAKIQKDLPSPSRSSRTRSAT